MYKKIILNRGTITLTDFRGNIADIKKYTGKKHRKKIIDRWFLLYKRNFYITIAPQENECEI